MEIDEDLDSDEDAAMAILAKKGIGLTKIYI